MAAATNYIPFPVAGPWGQIGSTTIAGAMGVADGSPIEISVGSPPVAGSRGIPRLPIRMPFLLLSGTAGSYRVYAMSPAGGGGAFLSTSA